MQRNTPVTFTSTMARHCAGSRSSNGMPGENRPALLNRTSRRPKRLFTASNSAATCFSSATSQTCASAAPPCASISALTVSRGSARRPASVTMKPACASAAEQARPMPEPAPVTIAIFCCAGIGHPRRVVAKCGRLSSNRYRAPSPKPNPMEKTCGSPAPAARNRASSQRLPMQAGRVCGGRHRLVRSMRNLRATLSRPIASLRRPGCSTVTDM